MIKEKEYMPVNDSDTFRILDKFIKEMKDEESKYLLLKIEGGLKVPPCI